MLFSERIRTRSRLWWSDLARHRPLHRLGELVLRRHRDEPDERWRCCEYWQRTLVNKWNAREFALRHGVRVPELYWYGWRPSAVPVEVLPANFVVRPVHGFSGRGTHVVVGERELLADVALPRAELRAALRQSLGRVARWPFLIQEFARREDGSAQLPTEYKCYTFGGSVAVIGVVYRTLRCRATQRFYTPDWTLIENPFKTDYPLAPPDDPPRCLDEILRFAATLGVAWETFVRSDFFATDAGAMFCEFSCTPDNGADITPEADAFLGDLWQRTFPDRT